MLPTIALVRQDEGLTLGRIIRDIPHDAAAIVVYLLIAAFVFAIWHGSRSKPRAPGEGDR